MDNLQDDPQVGYSSEYSYSEGSSTKPDKKSFDRLKKLYTITEEKTCAAQHFDRSKNELKAKIYKYMKEYFDNNSGKFSKSTVGEYYPMADAEVGIPEQRFYRWMEKSL